MPKHTPGPWVAIRQRGIYKGNYNIGRLEDQGNGPLLTFVIVLGPNDFCPPRYGRSAEANAEFIVRACNTHNDLLTACEALLAGIQGLPPLTAIEGVLEAQFKQGMAAIAKAKGE